MFTCQRALRAYVLAGQRPLRGLVPKYQIAFTAYMLYVPICLTCLRNHVPTCIEPIARHGLRDQVITCHHASFDVTCFGFAAFVAEVVHTAGNA